MLSQDVITLSKKTAHRAAQLTARIAGNGLFFFIFLKGRFVFVCHLAGIPHSGGNTHLGQNIHLQNKPCTDNTKKNQQFFHYTSFQAEENIFH